VIGELLGHGAEVIGLVRDRLAAVSLPWRIHILYGRPEDRFRVYSALAIHEIATVFHLDTSDPGTPDQANATVIEAVRLYDRRIPLVTARLESAGPDVQCPVPGVRLGVLRLAERTNTTPGGDLRDAARACLRLAEQLAAHAEPRVEEVPFVAGWNLTPHLVAAPERRAA
jgi:hypothetical protein